MEAFYKPWIGKGYKPGGVLILSESAYCWDGGCPKPSHPTKHTAKLWVLSERFETRQSNEARYAAAITRSLTQLKSPTLRERSVAWGEIAYSIYIQRPMADKKNRPTKKDFQEATKSFFELIEDLRPCKIVITSITVWNQMPDTQEQVDSYKQAYRLKDGSLVWCLALAHPASRKKGFGFRWSDIGQRIKEFREEELSTA